MYEGYTNIFPTPKGILISDNHCIRHAGYENIDAIPNDVLITGIHCSNRSSFLDILHILELESFVREAI